MPIDPVPFLKEAIRVFAASLPPTIRLRLDLEPEIPIVNAQFRAIKEVVSDLLSNAKDAVSLQGGTVSVRLGRREISDPGRQGHVGSPSGNYLTLLVEDDGAGIDPNHLAHIFDPFHTTKTTGAPGLGLSAVHAIVRDLGGWIDVRSRLGAGSQFEVFLPAVASPRIESEDAEPEVPPAGRQATVLFADDEPDIRSAITVVLESSGHRILVACDGQEAVELVDRHAAEIDLVILDSKMPRCSGSEAFLRIHAAYPALPILISSGDDPEEIFGRLGPKGLFGVLPKPYEFEELEQRISEALDRRRAEHDSGDLDRTVRS